MNTPVDNEAREPSPGTRTKRIMGKFNRGHALIFLVGIAFLLMPSFVEAIHALKILPDRSSQHTLAQELNDLVANSRGLSNETKNAIDLLVGSLEGGFTFETICLIVGTFAIGLGLIFTVTPMDVDGAMRIQGSWKDKNFSLGEGVFLWIIVIALPATIGVSAYRSVDPSLKGQTLQGFMQALVELDRKVHSNQKVEGIIARLTAADAFRAPYEVAFDCATGGGLNNNFAVRFGDDIEVGFIPDSMRFTPRAIPSEADILLANYTAQSTSVRDYEPDRWLENERSVIGPANGDSNSSIRDFLLVTDIDDGQLVSFTEQIPEPEAVQPTKIDPTEETDTDILEKPKPSSSAATLSLTPFAVIGLRRSGSRGPLQRDARSIAKHAVVIKVEDASKFCELLAKQKKRAEDQE
ncbi:MAG: hypothetical protein WA921_13630 [Ahrensia sp.]